MIINFADTCRNLFFENAKEKNNKLYNVTSNMIPGLALLVFILSFAGLRLVFAGALIALFYFRNKSEIDTIIEINRKYVNTFFRKSDTEKRDQIRQKKKTNRAKRKCSLHLSNAANMDDKAIASENDIPREGEARQNPSLTTFYRAKSRFNDSYGGLHDYRDSRVSTSKFKNWKWLMNLDFVKQLCRNCVSDLVKFVSFGSDMKIEMQEKYMFVYQNERNYLTIWTKPFGLDWKPFTNSLNKQIVNFQ